MSDVIERIQQKLAYLREHEDYDVTDADAWRQAHMRTTREYRYQLSAPAAEAQVAAYEAQHEIRFPDDYRRFLLEVGTGGPGPNQNLYSPFKETLVLPSGKVQSIETEYTGRLNLPFPFIDTISMDVISGLLETLKGLYGKQAIENFLGAGNIMVADSGGSSCHLLVITGAARGQIWDVDALYTPVMISGSTLYYSGHKSVPPDAKRVNFTQWYDAWLDVEIARAQSYWQKRGRVVPPLVLTETDERIWPM